MAIVILQGPQLNSDIAAAAAERLGGALEQRADHYRVHGSIGGAEAKREFLLELCRQLAIPPTQAVAMGDGANDLLMMQAAGLSIAYHAKPKVQAAAHAALNHCTLAGVLALLED